MPLSKDDRGRLIGVLYLSALFGGSDTVEMSNNLRRLMVELRTAATLSKEHEAFKQGDLKTLARAMDEWRNNILDNLDKDHIKATGFCYTILDELSVLVEERYGKVDFNDYTRIMRPAPTEG
jgi:hypothetical protein